tara:strand:- start:238 stop:435 length:198 start_codon:yes stop_codon:yes gene_type:complete
MRSFFTSGAGTGVGIKRWPWLALSHDRTPPSAPFPRSLPPYLRIITTGGNMGYRFTDLTTACQQD